MRHRHLELALAVIAFASGGSALGAGRRAENRCADAARELRGIVSSRAPAEENLPTTKGRLQHISEVLASTRKLVPEIDQNDPSVAECTELVAQAEKIALYLKGRQDRLERQQAFFTKHKDKEKTVNLLADLYRTRYEGKDLINGADASVVKGWRDTLKALDATCKSDWPEYDGKMVAQEPFESFPNNWCYMASGADVLTNLLLKRKRWFVQGWGFPLMHIPDLLVKLPKEPEAGMDAWLADLVVDDAEFKTKYNLVVQAYMDVLGYDSTGAIYDPIAEGLAKLRAAIDEAAPRATLADTGHHDASLEGRAALSLKKIFADARIVRSVMDAPGYSIDKNAFGIPKSRYRSGQIMFKLPKSQHCLVRTFNYVEDYAGAGTYAPSQVNVLGSTRFASCK